MSRAGFVIHSAIRQPRPVRHGDLLRLRAEEIDFHVSERCPSLSILDWPWKLFNRRGLCVLDLQATRPFTLRVGVEACYGRSAMTRQLAIYL